MTNVEDNYAIAIVGMSIMAPPGQDEEVALDLDRYWEFLYRRKNAKVEVPKDRWNADAYHGTGPGQIVTTTGCFIPDVNRWDPQEFGITAKEAHQVSHSQGLLLHVTHDALQDSGIDYRGKPVGVYVGAHPVLKGWEEDITSAREYYNTGNFLSIAANRLSYVFDLIGPSMPVDTACSASLTATHLAVQAIRAGDCESAVVAGCNLIMSPIDTAAFSKLGVLSPTGESRAFDADANGYARGDIIGSVILKRYDLAKRDGDKIRSVIVGSALACCGSLMGSITTPSPVAQKAAIEQSYADAGLRPCDADYVELHGTGTTVGDTIEANAAGEIFSQGRDGRQLLIGSVKSNIGHGELAAYMGSLIKCTLMLENHTILPNGYFKTPSARIKWAEYNMGVATTPIPLIPTNEKKHLIVSISSFGFGGAGGHTVLRSEDPREPGDYVADNPPYLFVVGGLTPKATIALAREYALDYQDLGQSSLSELMGQRARQMTWRSYIVGDNVSSVEFPKPQVMQRKRQGPLCMLFSGQGPQHIAMGCGLFRRFKVFRDNILECDSIYKKYMGESMLEKTGLFIDSDVENSPTKAPIWPAGIISSATTIFQIALFELMKSLGFRPDVIIGHSIGESAVLYASGAMSKESVVQVAAARGRALQLVDGVGGSMAALGCSSEKAEALIEEVEHMAESPRLLHVAAYNSPQSVGVSGPSDLIDYLVNYTKKWHIGIRATKLKVSTAVHSPFVDPCEEQYRADLAKIFSDNPGPHRPLIPVISTVTGEYMHSEYTVDYLWKNMRQPVCFVDAVTRLVHDFPELNCLEYAPHPVLGGYIQEMGADHVFGLVSRPKEKDREEAQKAEVRGFLKHLGEINISGVNCLNFAKLNGEPEESLALKAPSYPFQYNMKLQWADPVPSYFQRLLPASRPLNSPLLRVSPELPGKWMGDHIIDKSDIVPASAYLEMGLEFPGVTEVYDVRFISAFALDDVNFNVSTLKIVKNENIYEVRSSSELMRSTNTVGSRPIKEIEWSREPEAPFDNLHCLGKLAYGKPDLDGLPQKIDIKKTMSTYTCNADGDSYYEQNSSVLQFGPEFRRLVSMHWNPKNPYNCMTYVRGMENLEINFQIHPLLSDALIQSAMFCFDVMTQRISLAMTLPHSVQRAFRNDGSTKPLALAAETCPVFSRLVQWDPDYFIVDVFLLSEDGDVLFSLVGLRINRVRRTEPEEITDRYTVVWQPRAVSHDNDQVMEMDFSRTKTSGIKDTLQFLQFLDSLANFYIHIYSLGSYEHNNFEDNDHEIGTKYLEWCTVQYDASPLTSNFHGFFTTNSQLQKLCSIAALSLKNEERKLSGPQSDASVAARSHLETFYSTTPFTENAHEAFINDVLQLVKLTKLSGKKAIRIVEINAAAGTMTEALGKALFDANINDCHIDYTCTDCVFDNASHAASRSVWRHIAPAALDLDVDLAEQDVAPADIIVGVNVISGYSMEFVVEKLGKLLLDGGSMVLMEVCGAPLSAGTAWFEFVTPCLFRKPIVSTISSSELISHESLSISRLRSFGAPGQVSPVVMVARSNLPAEARSSAIPQLSTVFPVTPPQSPHKEKSFDSEFETVEVSQLSTNADGLGPDDDLFLHFEFGKEMDLVDLVNKTDDQSRKRLWLHTSISNTKNAALLGIARSMRQEYYHIWDIHVVEFIADWDVEKQEEFIHQNLMKVLHLEEEIRVTADGALEVCRLVSVGNLEAQQPFITGKPIAFNSKGQIWAHYPLPLNEDDIEVTVKAIKLNDSGSELIEFSGIVADRGPKAEISLGARVVGVIPQKQEPLSNVIVCNYGNVVKIPERYSLQEGVSITGPLFKCAYTLDLMAQAHHGKPSGKHAVIYASTSERPWSLLVARVLKFQGWCTMIAIRKDAEAPDDFSFLGPTCIIQSARQFVTDVLRWTNGSGADYIFSAEPLNSEFIAASMEALDKKFGIFSASGQFEPPRTVGSQRFISLNPGFDLEHLPFALLTAVKDFKYFEHLDLTSHTILTLRDLSGGIQVKDSDDFVVNLEEINVSNDLSILRPGIIPGTLAFDPRRAYVLVGGVGGLGVYMAHFIVRNGGRRVIITSRKGMKGFEDGSPRDRWLLECTRRTPGALIDVLAVDSTDINGMKSMFKAINVPVAGVMYLAVKLCDSLFSCLTKEMWDEVYDVKVKGVQVLQQAIDFMKLDWLVFCSSVLTVIGSPGQANYLGAQTIMERMAEGIPNCIAVGVPPITDGGIFVRSLSNSDGRNAALAKYIEFGMEMQEVCQKILDAIRSIGKTSLYIPTMDWDLAAKKVLPPGQNQLIRHLLSYSNPTGDTTGGLAGHAEISTLAAAALSMNISELEPNVPLASYGLDSLTAVKLSTSIKKTLGLIVTQMQLLSANCTIDRLEEMLQEYQKANVNDATKGVDISDDITPISSILSDVEATAKTVTQLNSVTSGQALFICHGAGGGLAVLSSLALAMPFPVYGIQPAPLSPTPSSFAELTSFYLAALQTVQPSGPYRLAGFSLGVAVATELANQLLSAGHAVSHVAFLDSSPMALFHPNFARYLADAALTGSLEAFVMTAVEDMAASHPDMLDEGAVVQFRDYFAGNGGERVGWVHDFATAYGEHVNMIYRLGIEMRKAPEKIGVKTWRAKGVEVLLVKASQGMGAATWVEKELTECLYMEDVEDVRVVDVKGTHFGILREESGLAEELRGFLTGV